MANMAPFKGEPQEVCAGAHSEDTTSTPFPSPHTFAVRTASRAPRSNVWPEPNDLNLTRTSGAVAASNFTYRVPSPPHVHVPQTREDQQLILPLFDALGYAGEDRDILKKITANDQAVQVVRDWKYENRRKAQPILSFLHLGPSVAARDIEKLRASGITMLLVIRNNMTAHARLLSGEKVARQLGIEAASVDVAGNQELIAAFPRAAQIISNHLITQYRASIARDPTSINQTIWGKVLVFCESGNERSAAVVAAYLMYVYGIDTRTAIQYVQSQRFCVAYDDGLKQLLLNYEGLLKAQKEVQNAGTSVSILPTPQPKAKRGRNEVACDDDEMDLDENDDEERFGNRRKYAPFH